ncbi:MAG: caspase family protein [Bacteroidia bacterium]
MNLISNKIVFYLVFQFLAFPFLYGQKLHLILVSLTNDPSIGKYCQINHQNLVANFRQITQMADMSLNLVEIQGTQVNTNSINRQLEYLEVAANDAVIFHYSGHGLNGVENFPYFLILGDKLTLPSVHEKLRKKGGRLTLTISDCCNFGFGAKNSPKWVTKSNMLKENCVRLMKQGRGNIIATSSLKGQASNYIENIGGLYTSSLIDALLEATKTTTKEKVDWKKIFEEANRATTELASVYDKQQTPIFQINPLFPSEEINLVLAPSTNENKDFVNDVVTSYTIVNGDTYSVIARKLLKEEAKNGKKVADLAKKLQQWNPTKKPTKLKIGDNIVVHNF